jgi:hypothetical protein
MEKKKKKKNTTGVKSPGLHRNAEAEIYSQYIIKMEKVLDDLLDFPLSHHVFGGNRKIYYKSFHLKIENTMTTLVSSFR